MFCGSLLLNDFPCRKLSWCCRKIGCELKGKLLRQTVATRCRRSRNKFSIDELGEISKSTLNFCGTIKN